MSAGRSYALVRELTRLARADLETVGRRQEIAAFEAVMLAILLAPEDVAGTQRITCQLIDAGLPEGAAAVILGLDLDQVNRALAARAQTGRAAAAARECAHA